MDDDVDMGDEDDKTSGGGKAKKVEKMGIVKAFSTGLAMFLPVALSEQQFCTEFFKFDGVGSRSALLPSPHCKEPAHSDYYSTLEHLLSFQRFLIDYLQAIWKISKRCFNEPSRRVPCACRRRIFQGFCPSKWSEIFSFQAFVFRFGEISKN